VIGFLGSTKSQGIRSLRNPINPDAINHSPGKGVIMKAIFETTDYGKIECTCSDDGKGKAYFFQYDLEADINESGQFSNPLWGQEYTVLWPIGPHWKTAILQIVAPRTIGEASVTYD
jgi:hypothetical protein